MCGRFVLFSSPRDIGKPVGVDWPLEDWPSRYNVSPGTEVVGVRYSEEADAKVFDRFWWGYLPRWAGIGAPQPINAQAEHLESSRYFRGAFHHHRCLIPADGWYEWQPHVGGKQPYYITREDRQPLYFAAIFEFMADGNPCCAIVTPTWGEIRNIHPRMPLVLYDHCLAAWIDLTLQDREAIQGAVKPLSPDVFSYWRVLSRVNSVRNDDPELVASLEPSG